jgi:hypothetical protein
MLIKFVILLALVEIIMTLNWSYGKWIQKWIMLGMYLITSSYGETKWLIFCNFKYHFKILKCGYLLVWNILTISYILYFKTDDLPSVA